jgi:hypothetical protein
MSSEQAFPESGMYLRDLLTDEDFRLRRSKFHDVEKQSRCFRRLTEAAGKDPQNILQELVDTAIEVCGADSAGISLEEPETLGFRWVAVAGSFSKYLNGRTDRYNSPCGKCLDSCRPQLYRVTQPFYDLIGVSAEPITDGVLIPWMSGCQRGTLWAVSHSAAEAFDREDFAILSYLAEFSSEILRYQREQFRMRARDHASTMARLANNMAHIINNPLQRLTNVIFLARCDRDHADEYLDQAQEDLRVLSKIVAALLKGSFENEL